jgi:serine/threonine protein kinase
LTFQLVDALAYCHRRGIVHRNLKPKHLLVIPGPCELHPLEKAVLKIADFALTRVLDQSKKDYTSEVITLWYRPPEILMGQRKYTAAVDMWSVGCIFAEMLQGDPLFTGLCEINQLFQIFCKLGLPDQDSWPEFMSLPHWQANVFPEWTVVRDVLIFVRWISCEAKYC